MRFLIVISLHKYISRLDLEVQSMNAINDKIVYKRCDNIPQHSLNSTINVAIK